MAIWARGLPSGELSPTRPGSWYPWQLLRVHAKSLSALEQAYCRIFYWSGFYGERDICHFFLAKLGVSAGEIEKHFRWVNRWAIYARTAGLALPPGARDSPRASPARGVGGPHWTRTSNLHAVNMALCQLS